MRARTIIAFIVVGTITAVVIAATGAPPAVQSIACLVLGITAGILIRVAERREP